MALVDTEQQAAVVWEKRAAGGTRVLDGREFWCVCVCTRTGDSEVDDVSKEFSCTQPQCASFLGVP